jgi:hypothetical protein
MPRSPLSNSNCHQLCAAGDLFDGTLMMGEGGKEVSTSIRLDDVRIKISTLLWRVDHELSPLCGSCFVRVLYVVDQESLMCALPCVG